MPGDLSNQSASDEGRFVGEAEVEIRWQAWLPAGSPRAAVVIAHGVSEHSGRYSHVAERLAGAGYATYGIDHRGHGRSGGDRVLIDRFAYVIEDLDQLVDLVAEQHPGMPRFLLGHSMGGGISIGYTLAYEEKLDGLILSAPLSNSDAATRVQRVASSLLSRIAPKLGIFPVDSATISRDPEVVRAYDEDPLVDRRKLPARTVAELTEGVDDFCDRVPALGLPVLLMHGTADELVPFSGSERLFEAIGSQDKTFKRYDGLYHEILNEPEQDEVITDVLDWLDGRVD
ncbi:monoacylglycerol lipase [soil metagenome]